MMTPSNDSDLRDFMRDINTKLDGIKSDLRVIDTRLIEVEKKVDKLDKLDARFDKLDNRLWVFAMLILGSSLTAIVKLFAFPSI
jgi:hypothetical protein